MVKKTSTVRGSAGRINARRTHTIWQYWHVPALSGLLPPITAPPETGCPRYTALLRQDGDEGPPPPFEVSAPHGARGSGLRHGSDLVVILM